MRWERWAVPLLIWGCANTAAAEIPVPPKTAWIVDATDTLSSDTIEKLDRDLAVYSKKSGNDLAVLLVPGTDDEALEDYAQRVIEAWGLGGDAHRAVLLIWSAEGYIAMGVGSGLADRLPPDVQGQIERAWIIPRFGNGDPDGGIYEGAQHIMQVLDGLPVTHDDDAEATAQAERNLAGDTASDEAPGAEGAAADLGGEESSGADGDPNAILAALAPEVARIADALSRSPGETVWTLWREASDQARHVPAALQEAWDNVPTVSTLPAYQRDSRLAALGLTIFVAVLLLGAQRPRTAALVVGIPMAALLWIGTGFTALSLAMTAFSLLFIATLPITGPIAREIFRREDNGDAEDERRRREAILAVTPKRPAVMTSRTTTSRTTTTTVTTATAAAAAAAAAMTRKSVASAPMPVPDSPPPRPAPSSASLTAGEFAELQRKSPQGAQLLRRIEAAGPLLSRVKTWQIGVAAAALFFVFPPLGVLGVFAAILHHNLTKNGTPLHAALLAAVVPVLRAKLRSK